MGGALVFDLVRSGATVWVTDVDPKRAREIADRYGAHVGDDFKKADVIVSAAPYRYNLDLAKCAVKARRHFCDLGGNTDVVEAELRLRPRGTSIIPDCGLQPGLGNALLGKAVREMGGRADSARILVGGLPQKPTGKLKYQLVFSIDGLINEYVSPVQILRDGKLTTVDPLSEVEPVEFKGFPALEAFNTGGSASTLPASYKGRVKRLEVKTIRYAGHAKLIAAVDRARLPAFITKHAKTTGPDLVLMRMTAEGAGRTIEYEIVDRAADGFSSMMRMTAFPASIVAQMAARGDLPKGPVRNEAVDGHRLLGELWRRGVHSTVRIS